ncbi:MAG: hypothetical protein V1835_00925 [Candidatus Micrarchaeota archaeon]
MNIIGGKVTKTLAEKYVENVSQTALAINLVIKSVELRGKQVAVKYLYEIDYKEKLAKMQMEGEIYLQDSDKAMKEMEEKWKKGKQIDQQIAEQLLNSITYSGMAVGTLLAFSVGIPAPITVQKFKVDTKASAG